MSSDEPMNDLQELEPLRKAYLSVKAPVTLAARIRRAVNEPARPERRYWVPVTVGAIALVGVAVMISLSVRQEPALDTVMRARPIPLSMIRGRLPSHPGFGMPSLMDIRPMPIVPSHQDMYPEQSEHGEEPQTRFPGAGPRTSASQS